MSMIAFWTGAAGMRTFQEKLNVVGHNISNVQTNGYKARRAAFEDLLYSRINTNVPDDPGEHLTGHGVRVGAVDQLMLPGGLNETFFSLDFAIAGEGFFQVDNQGEIEFTRNGAFELSMEGNVPTLVTNDGAYVLDRAGNRITLERMPGSLEYDLEAVRERLGIYRFDNPWGLEPHNNARYRESANSGAPQLVQPGQVANGEETEVLRGYLEMSGVNLGGEIIEMIMAQRAFQISSRVLQTADQIADELNQLR